MQQREAFCSFLQRIAANQMLANDWQDFAVTKYEDEQLESLRSSLVERAQSYHDLIIGWIPKEIQILAGHFAEALINYVEDTVFYRTQYFEFDEEKNLNLRSSVWTLDSHCSCILVVRPDEEDYPFWCWVVESPKRRAGTKSADQIAALRSEFAQKM